MYKSCPESDSKLVNNYVKLGIGTLPLYKNDRVNSIYSFGYNLDSEDLNDLIFVALERYDIIIQLL